MSDYDGSWKEALEEFLRLFLAFFFPEVEAEIDWGRDSEPLEQELRQLAPQSAEGRKFCDVLVKLYLRDSDDWVYLHVEVQNWFDANFAYRVYVYNSRAEDKYSHPIVSLAVLGDDSPGWEPNEYRFERWGCEKTFRFPVVKLLKFRGKEEQLEKDANVVALLVLTHLKAMETRGDAQARFEWKLRLVKGLYTRPLDAEQMRRWFRIMDWLLDLPPDWQKRMLEEIRRFEKEKQMKRLTSFEEIGLERGLERGEVKGLLKGIETVMDLKFGAVDAELMRDLEQAKPETLQRVLAAIKTANSAADLRALLTPNGESSPVP